MSGFRLAEKQWVMEKVHDEGLKHLRASNTELTSSVSLIVTIPEPEKPSSVLKIENKEPEGLEQDGVLSGCCKCSQWPRS